MSGPSSDVWSVRGVTAHKPTAPAVLWESVEMLRKLLLCIIGAFWSSKSTMAVATALFISVLFQMLHEHFQPFKSLACNRLQSASLAITSLIYFVGVLLKTQTVDSADEDSVGGLMVTVVVLVLLV